jgi:DNA repair exonuclease SbcCD ATPase subunit
MILEGFNRFVQKQTILFNSEVYYVVGNNLDHPVKSPSNGAGKSSILNAICWGLFGKTVSRLRAREVMANRVKKAQVILNFDNGLEVCRTHDTYHRLYFSVNGKRYENDVIETQEELNKHLGLNWDTFQSTCCMFSGGTASKFLEARPGERAAILGNLVNDSIFQQASTQMMTDYEYYQKQRGILESNRNILNKQIEEKYIQLEQFLLKYSKAQAEEANRKTLITMRIADIQNQIKQILLELDHPPIKSVEEIQAHISTLIQNYKTQYDKLKYIEFNMHPAEDVVEGSHCSKCKRYIDANAYESYKLTIEDGVKEFQTLSVEVKEIAKQIEIHKEEYNKTFGWWQDKAKKEETISEYKINIMDLEESLNQNYLGYLEARKQELEKEVVSLSTTIKDIDEQIYSFNYYENILKQLIPGFKNEIKNILFDNIRGDLEYNTTLFAQQFAEDMFKIYYPNKDLNYKEKFEILMEAEGTVRDISTYSPGERWRASFACLLALRYTMMQKTKSKLNLLLIDDPMGEIDDGGCEELFKVINNLWKQEKNLVLVTLPKAHIIPPGSNIISVERKDYVSRICK